LAGFWEDGELASRTRQKNGVIYDQTEEKNKKVGKPLFCANFSQNLLCFEASALHVCSFKIKSTILFLLLACAAILGPLTRACDALRRRKSSTRFNR